MHLSLIPEDALKGADKPFCVRTRSIVSLWRSQICCRRNGVILVAVHNADLLAQLISHQYL